MVTTKLLVPAGALDQASCGDMSCPPGTPKTPLIWAGAISEPSVTSALVKLSSGTLGIRS